MKAVVHEMPRRWMEERRESDAFRWDEVWDGVLHMSPPPNRDHQRFVRDLQFLLHTRWAKPNKGQVDQEVSLTAPEDEEKWRSNYRVPDLVLLPADRRQIDKNEYMVGAPLVCIEIRSPGDESYEKSSFYAELGVPEVWIIDRDTKNPEVYILEGASYRLQVANDDGWIQSTAVAIRMKAVDAKLLVRFGDELSHAIVPE